MQVAAFIVMVAAWGSMFLWRGTAARLAQLIVFGLPSQASPFIFVCGPLTLLSQAGTILLVALGNEGGMDWPSSSSRTKRPPRRR
jgi:hypothetical protein